MLRSRGRDAPGAPRVQEGEWTVKKQKDTKLKLRLDTQTIRDLIHSDYRAVVSGSSVVYTCTTSGAQTADDFA